MLLAAKVLIASVAMAGEHRDLCEKISAADLVFEMRFTQAGRYPSSARAKQWAPPQSELEKTARTGTVVHSYKGDLATDSPWLPAYGVGFQISASVAKWDEFFSHKTFSKVYFLTRDGERFRSAAWAEETAGCGSSDHWSWCPGFETFKAQVEACLAEDR